MTIVLYAVFLLLAIAVLVLPAWFIFGRGETLPGIPQGKTVTRLPVNSVSGDDARELKFQLVLRGYKQSEVDWAIEKLAREIDELRFLVENLQDENRTLS